ncbi:hypothetical protein H5410_006229 [Solanum commersonii]|uniref:Uncharacterized protein n=1 Tax=Solanum commersonii TaxID=4109 RepID=A0A9J6A9P9_SOLCO|nr:hypothetical protein H5410_006229 [Solanum commersonii]
MDEMIQETSSMTTTQSFIGVASSCNIKCSFCLCEECEQQHDYFISHVKELTDIFKEMTYNIDVYTSKKISQPLKLKEKKSMTIAPVSHSNPKGKEKEKEKEKENEKEQEKNKEKEKVKKERKRKEKEREESFNIDGEGPTKLMSSFSQWINEGLYKHHAKKRDKDNHYLANCSDLEFKQLDFVFAFPKKKDWFYVMSQPNKCWTDEYVDVILYYLRKKSKQHSHSNY